MANLNHLAVFQVIAQTSSFTGAARQLGMDKAQVSRVLRALEGSLGTVLMARTTRSVTLTAEGERLLREVAEPLRLLEAAAAGLPDRRVVPAGEVTLATTPDLGRSLLPPILAAFRTRFPLVRVELLLDQDVVQLQATRSDLALRVGRSKAAAMKVRKLSELEAGFFASPRYVSQRGMPASVEELHAHDGLWPPSKRGRTTFASARARPPAAISCDDFVALLALARAGCGVALLPLFLARPALDEGSLVRVVPQVTFGGAPLYLVTPPERPLPPRVVALRDFLVEGIPRALA